MQHFSEIRDCSHAGSECGDVTKQFTLDPGNEVMGGLTANFTPLTPGGWESPLTIIVSVIM